MQNVDKHVYVHTAHFGWCTIPTKFDTKLSAILAKCDLELVLLYCWSFGEVAKIRRPNIPVTPLPAVIPKNVQQEKTPAVIPQNVPEINPCKVSIERLPTLRDVVQVKLLLCQKLSATTCVYDHLQRKSLTECQVEKDPKWTIHNTMLLMTHPLLPRKKEEWTSRGDHQQVE